MHYIKLTEPGSHLYRLISRMVRIRHRCHAVLVAMLYERYKAGEYPIALVSMDNCSQNGAKLRESVLTMTEEWKKAGFVDDGFISYVSDEKVVAFPWTMIDKITPRPGRMCLRSWRRTD